MVDADEGSFSVSIIPHTLAETVLQHKKQGTKSIWNAMCWANISNAS
ncbi:hypothetical protein LJK88_30765 [Paenibacillus sp. P26]|nr:hypothetical protein LJK88_30765 [Paenibacillus sp. P26]